MVKIIDGILVSSKEKKRMQIRYNSDTGIILEVGDLGIPKEEVNYYFHDDCLVFAGMSDIHIHAREDVSGKENYKEDYITASKAAINGGVTCCLDMPNNPRPPVDDDTYRAKFELTKKGLIPLFLYAGIGPRTKPLSFPVPYKVYMGPSVGHLFFDNRNSLKEAVKHYRGHRVSFHCEDPEVLHECKNEKTHLARRPVRAELMATETALELISEFGLHGKLCHFSAGEGLHKIRKFREKGIDVTCEVTPQHLYFSDEMIRRLPENRQVYFQMNPPIRSEREREMMFEAFLAGDIDFLATDHAPHTHEEKQRGTSGLTGLDTFGAFVTWAVCEKGACPKLMAKMCSENPGRFINRFLSSFLGLRGEKSDALGYGFGFIEKGYSASFSVLNMKKPFLVVEEKLQTKVGWSPFNGIEFPGRVESIFVQGHHYSLGK